MRNTETNMHWIQKVLVRASLVSLERDVQIFLWKLYEPNIFSTLDWSIIGSSLKQEYYFKKTIHKLIY